MLKVEYVKGKSPKQTKRDSIKAQARQWIEEEVTKWVLGVEPEYREQVKQRIIKRMLNNPHKY